MKIDRAKLSKALNRIGMFVGKNAISPATSMVHFKNLNNKALRYAASFSIPRTKNTACYRNKDKEVSKMPYSRKAFGIVISSLRVQKGLTQEGMSGLAGMARSHLAALENGEKTVKLDTMWRIADALGIAPSELIRKTEQESKCIS